MTELSGIPQWQWLDGNGTGIAGATALVLPVICTQTPTLDGYQVKCKGPDGGLQTERGTRQRLLQGFGTGR